MTNSRDEERVVGRLVRFAGDPVIVEDALELLRQESPVPPTLEQLLQKILELRVDRGFGLPDNSSAVTMERAASG